MFYDKDNLFFGLAMGFAIPFVTYAILLSLPFRHSTDAVMALCVNAILVRWYRKKKYDETIRGFVIATAIYSIAWLFVFGKDILETFSGDFG